jgi:hypothetical protein
MRVPPARLHRVFHWIGLALAVPVLLALGIGIVWWLRGEFPPTVTGFTVVEVLAFGAGIMVLVYLCCRVLGFAAVMLIGERS